MDGFVKVASVSDIPSPGKLCFDIDDRLLVLVRVDDAYFCLDDVCTHDGGPLGEGPLCGFELSCPRHGARFDVRTGKPLSMPATEPTATHEVKIDSGDVYVRLKGV